MNVHASPPNEHSRRRKISGIPVCVLLMLFMLNSIAPADAQQTCSNPQTITIGSTDTIVMTDSVYWLEFQADSAAMEFVVANLSTSEVVSLVFFQACGDPLVMDVCESRVFIDDSILIPSNLYILKLYRQNHVGSISISLTYLSNVINTACINFQFVSNPICQGQDMVVQNLSDDCNSNPILTGAFHFYYWAGNSQSNFIMSIDAINFQWNTSVTLQGSGQYQAPNAPGTYTIYMTYTDNGIPCKPSCCDHVSHPITILPKPSISISQSNPNPVCIGEDVWLSASANSPLTLTSWQWSNGQTTNPALMIPLSTTTYILTATANNGCSKTIYWQITTQDPEPDFTYAASCQEEPVVFSNLTTCNPPSVTTWLWNFGDGTTSTSFQPTHTFQGTQTSYNVILTVTDINGIHHSVSKTVTLLPAPVASAISGKNNNCDGNIETYSIPAIYTSYLWTIVPANAGTVIAGTGTNQVTITWNLPSTPDYATLSVSVTNAYNCEATFEKRVFACCDVPTGIGYIHYNGTSIASTIVHTQSTVYINDHVTITGFLDLQQCEILMGPDAVIEAKNGGSLRIQGGIVQQYCNYMWKTIQASDNQSQIICSSTGQQPTIRDGQIAFQSINGGVLDIKYTNLIDNHVAIKISDYLPAGGSPLPAISLIKSTITTAGIHELPYDPYKDQPAYAGVVVDRVNQVTIGENCTSPNNRLNFSYMRYGIKINDAYVKVKGCEFDYIEYDDVNSYSRIASQGAIYAVHSYLSYTDQAQKKLDVGSATVGDECFFSNGKVGIFAENCKLEILGSGIWNRNQFSVMTEYGIKLINPHKGSLVSNNQINQSRLGIWAANILQGTSTGLTSNITIAANIIDNGKFGIWAQNFSTYNRPLLFIKDNEINLSSSIDEVYGIRVDACNGSNVSGNVITRGSSNPDANDVVSKKGIWLARTKQAAVYDNIIHRMGSGIYGNGDMINTQFFCNAFTSCWHPIYFGDYSVITNQGYEGTTTKQGWITNNVFYNSFDDKLAGTLNLASNAPKRQWYYNGNTSSEFDPSPIANSLLTFVVKNALTSNFIHSCDASSYKISAIAIEDAYQRDAMLGDILNELNEYNQLPEEFTWYEKAYLYEVLAADTTLMYLDTIVDYANFYYLMNNDNIGRFASIRDLIASGEINRAEELNAEINDTSTIGTNTRILNSIYLRTVETDVLDFTQSEEEALMEIALQIPYFGGDAVYEARVLLGLDILDYPWVSYRQQQPEEKIFNEFKVYPNPASDLLVFESSLPLPGLGLLYIFTSSGKQVRKQPVEADVMQFSINISGLAPGIYFYSYVSSNYTTNGRFVKK